MSKILAAVMLCLSFAITACSSSNYNSDEVPDISPENLYNIAKANMADGDFAVARRYLEALDSRYPFGEYTDQVQLDLIYVYYKDRETDLADAQIDRFIRLNPTHQNIDYVYYMKGLTAIQHRADILQDYFGIDRAEKDASYYHKAFKTFKDLITAYPDSVYAADARQRMIYIKDELARREFAIAFYYFEREAFLSAIRHCQTILYSYRDTAVLEDALYLMAYSFDRLNLTESGDNVRAVIAETYNQDYVPKHTSTLDNSEVSTSDNTQTDSQEDKGFWDSFTSWFSSSDEA